MQIIHTITKDTMEKMKKQITDILFIYLFIYLFI